MNPIAKKFLGLHDDLYFDQDVCSINSTRTLKIYLYFHVDYQFVTKIKYDTTNNKTSKIVQRPLRGN